MTKILLVGGTWVANNNETPHKSSIVRKMKYRMENNTGIECTTYNGGNYTDLVDILNETSKADITIWMPNVPDNDLPKLRNVKAVAPHTILITSKRNDNNKYSFGEIIQRALGSKSNLLIEFRKTGAWFEMSILDPLGNEWYNGTDIDQMVDVLLERALFLKNIKRQGTIPEKLVKPELDSSMDEFINIVQKCGKVFAEYTPSANNTTRLLGNCSTSNPTRCTKGFPTMRSGDIIFVSERNIDKTALNKNNLVPVLFDGQNIKYDGKKPSVDTPIQVRLYKYLPNINYMIHSHCYIKDAPFTDTCIPCGGLEEVKEILKVVDKGVLGRNTLFFAVNLKGHGSIVMANSLSFLENIEESYYARNFPEKQY